MKPLRAARLIARVDAKARHPHQIVAAKKHRQALPLPRRQRRLLEEILQRPARALRIGLQAFAAFAQANPEGIFPRRIKCDSFAAPFTKTNFSAKARNRQTRLARPAHRSEVGWRRSVGDDAIAVNPEDNAVVLEPRSGTVGAELPEHLDELGLARRAQAFREQELA